MKGKNKHKANVNKRIAKKAGEFDTKMKGLQAEFAKSGNMHRLSNMLLVKSTLDYLPEISESGAQILLKGFIK